MATSSHENTQLLPDFLQTATDKGADVVRVLFSLYSSGNLDALEKLSSIAFGGNKIAQQTIQYIDAQSGNSNEPA